jgi:hypothetical protein
MPRLITCTHCQAHIRSDEKTCPLCGAARNPAEGQLARTASAVLMGLTIAGCGPGTDGTTASAGMSASEGTSTTTESGTSGSSPSEGTWGEPDYGVPDTGWYEESGSETFGTSGTSGATESESSGSDSSGSETDGTTGGTETSDTGHSTTEGGDEGPIDTGVEPLYGVGDSGI